MTTTQANAARSYRVVVPGFDGTEIAGEFSTLLNASIFQVALIAETGKLVKVERRSNGHWFSY
jgi:hypothetical protein